MKTLIIAPHADDETLGLGGTLLKRSSKKGMKEFARDKYLEKCVL